MVHTISHIYVIILNLEHFKLGLPLMPRSGSLKLYDWPDLPTAHYAVEDWRLNPTIAARLKSCAEGAVKVKVRLAVGWKLEAGAV